MNPDPTFRDPGGALEHREDCVIRRLTPEGAEELARFLASRTAAEALAAGRLPQTRIDGLCAEHERIPFVTYPWEWSPAMLHAAAGATLELARRALTEDMGLKDATPHNIVFRRCEPVHVDLLSFERRDPADPTWLAYGQFVRTFLLPLLTHRKLGLNPGELLAQRRDGLQLEEAHSWIRGFGRLDRDYIALIGLPLLSKKASFRPPACDPPGARFILDRLYAGLERHLARLAPRPANSSWSAYAPARNQYEPEQFERKERFVRRALAEARPSWVLDAGSNTGHFSFLAAEAGAEVVAADADAAAVDRLFREARARRSAVWPLVADLSRPTPAMGWLNRESTALLHRFHGRFDMVLMLALAHHLAVTERVPLPAIAAFAAGLTQRWAVVEWVEPGDPMFDALTRRREHLYREHTAAAFESAFRECFDILRSERLTSHRTIYALERRASASLASFPPIGQNE